MKIIADKQSKLYELTYLLPADLTDAQLSTTHEVIVGLVAKYKGAVVAKEDWGKKDLAYRIKHGGKQYAQAVYTHLILKFSPEKVSAFEKEIFLLDELLRHLLVVSEDQDEKVLTDAAAPAKEKAAPAKKSTKAGEK